MLSLEQIHRRRGIFGDINIVTVLQRRAEALPCGLLIINDEQRWLIRQVVSHLSNLSAGVARRPRFEQARPSPV